MANNLRYLLQHFCLDGQKIDISSQLDEENADKIEKLNNETVPSINSRIDEIKDTDISNINSRIDDINQKVDTINNTTIPSVQRSVTAVDEKVDEINKSAAKNTKDISSLLENVTTQGNEINSIKNELSAEWTVLLNEYRTPKGFIINMFANKKMHIVQIHARCNAPQTVSDGNSITETIPNLSEYTPHHLACSAVYFNLEYSQDLHGVFSSFHEKELTLSFVLSTFEFTGTFSSSLLYYY